MCERKSWTEKEDQTLKELKEVRKIAKWSKIASIMKQEFKIFSRNGKQCRERYHNHLDSRISKEKWEPEEQKKLIVLHNEWGNRWAAISRQLQGRTDNCVKNHFYSYFRKCIKVVNSLISKNCNKKIRPLKLSIMNKIIFIIQSYQRDPLSFDKNIYQQAKKIKIAITNYSENLTVTSETDITRLEDLVKKVAQLNKVSRNKVVKRRKLKLCSDQSGQQRVKNNQYFNQQENQNNNEQLQVKQECIQTQEKIKIEHMQENKENILQYAQAKKQNNILLQLEHTPLKQVREEKQKNSSYLIINSVDYLQVKSCNNFNLHQLISIDDQKQWKLYFQ